MPRRIEKRQRGTKDSWTLAPEWCAPHNIASDHEWRYAGGVLEHGHDLHGWAPVADQAPTIAERSKSQGYHPSEYRLRPYDDAPATVVARAHLGHTHRGRCGGCGKDYVVQSHSQVVSYECGTCHFAAVVAATSTDLDTVTARAREIERLQREQQIYNLKEENRRLVAERDRAMAAHNEQRERAAVLGDANGALQTENTRLHAECNRLRVRAEDAERKAKVRR